MLNRWMRQPRDVRAEALHGTGRQTSQAALTSRLRRENERLRYQQRPCSRGMMCSMNRQGDHHDNRVIENIIHTRRRN